MHFFCGCVDHLHLGRKGGSAPQTAACSFPAMSTSVTQWMSHHEFVISSLYCGPCRWTPAVVAVTYLFMYPSLRYTHSLALVFFLHGFMRVCGGSHASTAMSPLSLTTSVDCSSTKTGLFFLFLLRDLILIFCAVSFQNKCKTLSAYLET